MSSSDAAAQPATATPPTAGFNLSELLTVEEAAAFVRRSTRTIRRWVEDGDLPHAVRLKQQIFIPRSDLEALFRPAHPNA